MTALRTSTPLDQERHREIVSSAPFTLAVLDRHLAGREHVVGERLTIADIALAMNVSFGLEEGVAVAPFDNLPWTRARSAAGTTAVVPRSDLLAVPPKDGLRRRERRHLGQKLSAEGLSLLGEQPALSVAEAKTLGPEPGPQHAVLGAQVLDRFALPATDPAGDQQNEEVKRCGGCHGRRTIARQALKRDVAPDRPQSRAIEFWYTTREPGHRKTDLRQPRPRRRSSTAAKLEAGLT